MNRAKYSCSSPVSPLLCRAGCRPVKVRDLSRTMLLENGGVLYGTGYWPLVYLMLACKRKVGFSDPHLLPPGPCTLQAVTGLPMVNLGRTDLASHTNDVSFGLYWLVLKLIH